MTFCEYDVVVLVNDLPEHGLSAGASGTIVMVYDDGAAFEIEFIGETVYESTLVKLAPDQIRLTWRQGIISP